MKDYYLYDFYDLLKTNMSIKNHIDKTHPIFLKILNIIFLLEEFYGYKLNISHQLQILQDNSGTLFVESESLREEISEYFSNNSKRFNVEVFKIDENFENIVRELCDCYIENLRVFINYIILKNSIIQTMSDSFNINSKDLNEIIYDFENLK